MTEASAPGDRAETDVEPDGATEPRRSRAATPLWLAVTLSIVFGVFYAYDVWEAVGNAVGMGISVDQLGIAITGLGTALLIAGIAAPLLVYAVAFVLGRRRGPLAQVVLYLTGYALVQVLSADIAALFELGGLDFS